MRHNGITYTSASRVNEDIKDFTTQLAKSVKVLKEANDVCSKTDSDVIKRSLQTTIENAKEDKKRLELRIKELTNDVLPAVTKEEEERAAQKVRTITQIQKVMKDITAEISKDKNYECELVATKDYGSDTAILIKDVARIEVVFTYPGDTWGLRPAVMRIEVSPRYDRSFDVRSRKYAIKKDGTVNTKKIKEVINEWASIAASRNATIKAREKRTALFSEQMEKIAADEKLHADFQEGYETRDYSYSHSRAAMKTVADKYKIYNCEAEVADYKTHPLLFVERGSSWTKDKALFSVRIGVDVTEEQLKAILAIVKG